MVSMNTILLALGAFATYYMFSTIHDITCSLLDIIGLQTASCSAVYGLTGVITSILKVIEEYKPRPSTTMSLTRNIEAIGSSVGHLHQETQSVYKELEADLNVCENTAKTFLGRIDVLDTLTDDFNVKGMELILRAADTLDNYAVALDSKDSGGAEKQMTTTLEHLLDIVAVLNTMTNEFIKTVHDGNSATSACKKSLETTHHTLHTIEFANIPDLKEVPGSTFGAKVMKGATTAVLGAGVVFFSPFAIAYPAAAGITSVIAYFRIADDDWTERNKKEHDIRILMNLKNELETIDAPLTAFIEYLGSVRDTVETTTHKIGRYRNDFRGKQKLIHAELSPENARAASQLLRNQLLPDWSSVPKFKM